MAKRTMIFLLLGVAACWTPASAQQRLSESANEMNSATRWGRMDVAIDLVGEKSRETFSKVHARWGRSLRIIDLEFDGLNLLKDGKEAEVIVNVSWQKLDDPDVRITSIAQRWADLRGKWSLLSEEEKGGDGGLLDEETKAKKEPPPAERSRFQTRVIREAEE